MKRRASQPSAAVIAERERIERDLDRSSAMLGTRAMSAQLAEYACCSDATELAELFAYRLARTDC